ncbi:MAG: hypothetical protein PHE24_05905 [Patescibacteria group bacterium]|nr:hypothetical protein [Patescibacteria group bacterium]
MRKLSWSLLAVLSIAFLSSFVFAKDEALPFKVAYLAKVSDDYGIQVAVYAKSKMADFTTVCDTLRKDGYRPLSPDQQNGMDTIISMLWIAKVSIGCQKGNSNEALVAWITKTPDGKIINSSPIKISGAQQIIQNLRQNTEKVLAKTKTK